MTTSKSYDPALANPCGSYNPLILSSDIPPPQTVYPRFLHADHPGPSAHFPRYSLSDDNLPFSSGYTQAAISSCKKAADERVMEAETIFGMILKIPDYYCACNSHILVSQTIAFKSFCDELVELTSRYLKPKFMGPQLESQFYEER